MVMELMDGYTCPVMDEDDFLWLVRDYMGYEAEDYARELLDEADAAIAERSELEDEIEKLQEEVDELRRQIKDYEMEGNIYGSR